MDFSPYKIKASGDDYTPINLYRTPEYKTFVQVYADWFNKGYIRKDILTAENVGTEDYEVKAVQTISSVRDICLLNHEIRQ